MPADFEAEQRIVRVGGTALGGGHSEYPTVLMGSIFFKGHQLVRDPERGVFDKDEARRLLDREGEWSERTGIPRILDVVGETVPALLRYIEFVATHTDAPFLLDSPSQPVRMDTVRRLAGSELMPRLIYNSIGEDYTEEELACLEECGVETAVLLAFSPRALHPPYLLRLVEEKLLPACRRAGVKQIIVDVGVLDLPGVGWAAQSLWEVKNRFGYPAGCAPSNALYRWKWRAEERTAFQAAGSAVFSLCQCFGADFLLYGSIAQAPWVYPACAAAAALLAFRDRLSGRRVERDDHPLYRLFGEERSP